jgi:DNA-binding beta-propeller fold protein YncE
LVIITLAATLHPAGLSPGGIAVRPNGRKIYLTNSLGSYGAALQVIDAATMTVIGAISDAPSAFDTDVTIAPDGKHAYADATGFSHAGGCSFYVIDLVASRVTGGFQTFAPCEFGSGLAVTPDGSQVLVPIEAAPGPGSQVWIFSTATNHITMIPVKPTGLAIRPDGRFAYVADESNNVEVMDLSTHVIVATIAVPSGASGPEAIVPPPEGVQFLTLSATLAMHAARSGAFSLQAQFTLSARVLVQNF